MHTNSYGYEIHASVTSASNAIGCRIPTTDCRNIGTVTFISFASLKFRAIARPAVRARRAIAYISSENLLNKKVLTTAILAGFAGVAHAQSSVTLYGLIDAGVTYVNHANAKAQSLYQYGDGVAQGSRWGLRGSEDLGNGLKAIFVLENGFNSGTGAAGQGGDLFGRQAYVGLTQDGVGSLTLGRQYSFSTDYLGGSYANGGQTVAGTSTASRSAQCTASRTRLVHLQVHRARPVRRLHTASA
jgi:hypothetical protein